MYRPADVPAYPAPAPDNASHAAAVPRDASHGTGTFAQKTDGVEQAVSQWLWVILMVCTVLLVCAVGAFYYFRIRKRAKDKFPPVDKAAEKAVVDLEAVMDDGLPQDPSIDAALEDELQVETEDERVRRLEWIRFYVQQKELARAHDLGWDGKPFKMATVMPAEGATTSTSVTVVQHPEDLGAGTLPPRNVSRSESEESPAGESSEPKQSPMTHI